MKDRGSFDIGSQEMSLPNRRLFIGVRLASLLGLFFAMRIAELVAR